MVAAKTIILVVSVMMPRDIPDIDHVVKVESFDACWVAAKEFVERDLSEGLRSAGAVGLKAMCAYQEKPSETN